MRHSMQAKMKKPAINGFSLNQLTRAVSRINVVPSKQSRPAMTKLLYTKLITSRKPIRETHALVSQKHCENNADLPLTFKKAYQTTNALQRVELPTCPLSATTRKACLDGNELVPGYLSGKVGFLSPLFLT